MSSRHAFAASITAAVAALALVGCSTGTAAPADEGAQKPSQQSSPAAAPTEDSAALQQLVLTTAELPTGGWTERSSGGSVSGGDATSSDAAKGGACELNFGSYVNAGLDTPTGQMQWNREATSSNLTIAVTGDASAATGVRALSDAIAKCPAVTAFTSNGQDATTRITTKNLGTWGTARTCLGFELNLGGSLGYGITCLVAVEDHLLLLSVVAPLSVQLPKDTEVTQITDAAVKKITDAA